MNEVIYEEIVKSKVVDLIQNVVTHKYKDIENALANITSLQNVLKMNIDNKIGFLQLIAPSKSLFEILDCQIRSFKLAVKDI